MAKVELNPGWWKKNAPKSIAGGEVLKALTEAAPKMEVEKSGDHASYFKALDKIKAAVAKDQQIATKAKDAAASAMLTELLKVAAQGRGSTESHLKHGGDLVAKGISTKPGVAVPPLKGQA
ncbi:MAG TPA: hypothetical protein VHW09_10405 [Bryobacteraceae bacterium]|jgi:hypothetical protein|nr:hypothetical protein [Bryobacteraceae bacterium]